MKVWIKRRGKFKKKPTWKQANLSGGSNHNSGGFWLRIGQKKTIHVFGSHLSFFIDTAEAYLFGFVQNEPGGKDFKSVSFLVRFEEP